MLYLAGSSASVLENILVEKEHLTTGVYYFTEDRPRTEIIFNLTSVATESLADVERRFFEVLRDAMENSIDMDYMRDCIAKHKRSWKFAVECSASSFAEYAISDYVFGKRDGSTLRDVATLNEYGTLEGWNDNQWRSFIKEWISDAPHVSLLGVPSAKLAAKLTADEETRVKKRREELGEVGLKKLAKELERARAVNEREIPRDEILKFKAPGTESIHFIHTITAKAGYALRTGRPENPIQTKVDADGADLPLFVHFEHISSNFVKFSLVISTSLVPRELLPLLSVYMESFFSLPILRGGKVIPFEQIIVELERDTVEYEMFSSPGDPEMLAITFNVEVEKYERAIEWLNELIHHSVFDVTRLKSVNKRLLSDVPDAMRDGSKMLRSMQLMMQYNQDSVSRARTSLVKARYLKRIKQMLATAPEEVVSRMETIRQSLFKVDNVRIFVAADLEKLPRPASAWKTFAGGWKSHSESLQPIIKPIERLNDAGRNPGKMVYVAPMPPIDSSFAYVTAKGPDSYSHPDLPAVMVAIAYFNAIEGPLWVAVRGTGLAYGATFVQDIDRGLIHYEVYRSPNTHQAFLAAKKAVEDHLSGEVQFDPTISLESAISSIVSRFALEQHSYFAAANESFVRQVIRELPSDYKEVLLKKIRAVTIDDLKRALREFILPIFTPGKSDVFITCAPAMEEVRTIRVCVKLPICWCTLLTQWCS